MSSIAIQFKKAMKEKNDSDRMGGLSESYEADSIRQAADDYDQFQLLVNSMEVDLRRLSGLSHSERDKLKAADLIPKYQPIALDYLESGDSYRNPVLVEVIIMMMDIGDIPAALELALPAVEQKQPMPRRFKKTNLPTFIADNVIAWSNAQLARDKKIEPCFSNTFEAMMDDGWKVPREVVAKFHKIAAEVAMKDGQLEQALEHFIRASEIDPSGAKCATKIAQLKKKLGR